jgi:hypothetical protein
MSRYVRASLAPHHRVMRPLPEQQWAELPTVVATVLACWGSRDYLAALWDDRGRHRLSINSTMWDTLTDRWRDGLTWDELMTVKEQCGFGDRWAVECYPPTHEVVDDANMRHLWLLPAPPETAWRTEES